MIENMRKYTGLMVVVLILLAAGLVITMQPTGTQGGPNSGDFMSVKGESISRNEYSKLGSRTADIAMLIGLRDYLIPLGFDSTAKGTVDFVANRIVLRKGAEELGIFPSEEATDAFLQKRFTNQDGEFDSSAYQNFLEVIAERGFTEDEFKELIGDYLVFLKTRDVVGGGLVVPRNSTIAAYELENQKVDVLTATYDIATFRDEIKPTDAQIKEYWEARKDKYLTDRKIKISYVLAHLSSADKPRKANLPPDTEPAVAAKIELDYDAKLEKWENENRTKLQELTARYSDFIDAVQDADGQNVKQHAEEMGFQVVTTDFFSQNDAPAELASLSTANYGPLPQAIFNYKFGDEEEFRTNGFELASASAQPSPFGPAQSQPEGHIFVRLEDQKKPTPKTFEVAKPLAKADYIAEKARAAMIAQAEKDQKALQELVQKGESFEQAAQQRNLTVVPAGPFGQNDNPPELNAARQVFTTASITDVNTIAENLVTTPTEAYIVYVKDRTIEIQPDAAIAESEQLRIASDRLKFSVFQAWLYDLRAEAEMKLPRTD